MKKKSFKWILKAVLLGGIFIVASGVAVMALWNWILPAAVGFGTLTFWQALGLIALSRLLFGGLTRGRRSHWWKHRMKHRWDTMSPDQRDAFKAKFADRCGVPSHEATASA
ncbi:MAG: hypothetical protein HQ500_13330 [Flavobacteriales bacterium]|nr:hypothetical protein [Flavobacteriales bacterium]